MTDGLKALLQKHADELEREQAAHRDALALCEVYEQRIAELLLQLEAERNASRIRDANLTGDLTLAADEIKPLRHDSDYYQILLMQNGMRTLFRTWDEQRKYLGDAYYDKPTGEWVALIISISPGDIQPTPYSRNHAPRSIANARKTTYRGDSESDAIDSLWQHRHVAWQNKQQRTGAQDGEE